MKISSKLRNILSRERRKEEARRKAQRELCRQRIFEALEPRQMLDAALYETLPDVITLPSTDNTWHYAIEGKNFDFVDTSSVDGLTASFPQGSQVSMTIVQTSTNGAVSTLGEVVIQLFQSEGEAPNSSSHFLELVASDYYEGLSLHRIMPGFMFQGGSPNGDGVGGSGLSIADEHSDVLTHSRRGTVAYANSGPNTSDAQFYITFDATDWLDGGYNVFGYVVDGYDVIETLENAEITHNNRGELSVPIDSFTLKDVHVVADSSQTQGVLRLTTDDSKGGKTVLSFTSENADGEQELQSTTVYVGEKGFTDYINDALAQYDFNLTAGESLEINLPTEFAESEITYSITADADAERYEIVADENNSGRFTIKTDKAGAQYLKLTVTASVKSLEMKTTTETDVFVAPVAPGVELLGYPAGSYGELFFIGSSFKEGEIQVSVEAYEVNDAITFSKDFVVMIDGVEYIYSIKSHTYDSETGLASYTLTLGMDEELAEGKHELSIQQVLSLDKVISHDPLKSEVSTFNFFYDPEELELADAPDQITAYAGVDDSYQFVSNKTNEDGTQRADVQYAFKEGSKVPSFLTLSADGKLTWNAAAGDAGTYEIEIEATDATGHVVVHPLVFNIAGKPLFADFVENTAKTGTEYKGQITANDSADPTIKMKYEIVGEDCLIAIDSETGVLSWEIPSDYLDSLVKSQNYRFVVKATELVEDEEGNLVDGASVEQEFTLEVFNETYVEDVNYLPMWNDFDKQTFKAGETFEFDASASFGSEVAGVEYSLSGDALPSGITIDSNGQIAWSPAEDFFQSTDTYSKTFVVKISARAILGEGENTTDYGDYGTVELEIELLNPNYVDAEPVIGDIDVIDAVTGETFETVIKATDPNNLADRISFTLKGENLPEGLSIDAETGRLIWNIPEDYLDSNVLYQIYLVTVVATEQYIDGDGYYEDGLSSERTFAIYIDNGFYDKDEAIVPVWEEYPGKTIMAGDDLVYQVVATAKGAEGVVYALTGDYPDDMKIDEDGTIRWSCPENFFSNTEEYSREIELHIVASAILKKTDVTTDFGDSASTTILLTVLNPDFEDAKPVFNNVGVIDATTGKPLDTTIVAKDPNNMADRIVYEIVGDDLPKGLAIDATTGRLTWDVPKDLLESNVKAQKITIVVKATEQYLGDDGKHYTDGLDATREITILVANSAYDESKGVPPVWGELEEETVEAGKTFETTVKAETPKGAEGVEYSLGNKAPEGMTIDPETGKITWKVPADYFDGDTKTESKSIKITINAQSILETGDSSVTYGESASTTLVLKIVNPDYVDEAPVFKDVDDLVVETGDTLEFEAIAKDNIGDADRIVYEIVNGDLPKGIAINKETGKVVWNVSKDYLASNVSEQVYGLVIKATKQFLQEDGSYVDGPSSQKTFEITVINKASDPEELEAPTIAAIPDQFVEAGKTLTFTVKAELPEGADAEGVRYFFAEDFDVPEGMTIDSKTGVVTWKVPADYFEDADADVTKIEIKVEIQVKTVVETGDDYINYGGAATATAVVYVARPTEDPTYDDWDAWYEAWVDATEERYQSNTKHLRDYLDAYLSAVEERDETFARAAEEYLRGHSSFSKLIQNRKDAQNAFEDVVAQARKELSEKDSQTADDYLTVLEELTKEFERLVKEGKAPSDAQELKDAALAKASNSNASSDSSNFYLSNKATGASVATDLTSILKMWRAGYSKASILDAIYSDPSFGEDEIADDSAPKFEDVKTVTGSTNETLGTTVKATDPDSESERIVYSLEGDNLPDGLSIDSKTGKITWKVPANYLASSVNYQKYVLTVKATEQYLSADGKSYYDGKSATKDVTFVISNAKYDKKEGLAPTFDKLDGVSVKAGETLETTVKATAPKGAIGVQYSLDSKAPSGMKIDLTTGKITWAVAKDYFKNDTKSMSATIKVTVNAETIISSKNGATNFGDTVSQTLEVTISNPNYKDSAPAFDKINAIEATTGKTLETTIKAKDPNGLADRVVYEFAGDDIPDGLKIDSTTGKITWKVPEDYLAESVKQQKFTVTVKATEQFLGEDGKTYKNGLSASQNVDIVVSNAKYVEGEVGAPELDAIKDGTVEAGKTFETTASATKPEGAKAIEYSLGSNAPDGMKIDSETGKISWASPKNYFSTDTTTESKTITITVVARVVLDDSSESISYGENDATSFKLTILNPNYKESVPVFTALDTVNASTGKEVEVTIKATDPNKISDRIVYELSGDDAPKGMKIDAVTGKLVWDVPEDLMTSDVKARRINVTVKATKQTLGDDGKTYVDGLSSTQIVEILVSNSSYDAKKGLVPEFDKLEGATVTAGKTLETTVFAKTPEGAKGVEYSLGSSNLPSGMKIHASSGTITWDVPENYFQSDKNAKSKTVTITVCAQTFLSVANKTIDYGESVSQKLEITVMNPNYVEKA